MRKQRGWTLVEILVVLVIIGILASITIVTLNGNKRQANFRQTQDFLAQAGESMDTMWGSVSSRRSDYGSITAVVSYIQKDLTNARVRNYSGGTNASTGPNDISVTLDQPQMVTACAKSEPGVFFCVRHDQTNELAGTSADTTSSNPRFSSFSNGSSEAAARTALASRTSAGSNSTTGKRGWNSPVACSGCTAGVLVTVSNTVGNNSVNDFSY